MGLKDEIIEQKRTAKKQAKLEAENAARERSQKFAELKENYEKGVVPLDWIDLYEKYALKIREWFSESSKDFSCREPVSEEYYHSKADNGDGSTSELILMNEYLAKRMQSDGFDDAIFELVEETETYLTSEDMIRQRAAQAEADRRNMEKYQRELHSVYTSDAYAGDGNLSYTPKLQHTTVSGTATGTRQVYYIVVECYIEEEDDDEDKANDKTQVSHLHNNTPPTKGVNLWRKKQILTCAGICAGIGLVTAVILLFTISILEMFIPIFAVIGFICGLLLGLFIRYIKLAKFAHNKGTNRQRQTHIVLRAILCIVALVAVIVFGIIVTLKLI